jgi:sigma-B regulation protein RsbU (phosphoserine phosphatase)
VLLERGGLVLGVREGVVYEEESIQLEAGDRLVLYTDGITEAADASQELFGEERLLATLRDLPADLSAREVADRILAELDGFLQGLEALDDRTLMVMRVLEPASSRLSAGGRELVESADLN